MAQHEHRAGALRLRRRRHRQRAERLAGEGRRRPDETPAAAFDRAYGAVGSPWIGAGTRAAIQDYANRASAKASNDRIARQVMLRTLMLAGPDAQVM